MLVNFLLHVLAVKFCSTGDPEKEKLVVTRTHVLVVSAIVINVLLHITCVYLILTMKISVSYLFSCSYKICKDVFLLMI